MSSADEPNKGVMGRRRLLQLGVPAAVSVISAVRGGQLARRIYREAVRQTATAPASLRLVFLNTNAGLPPGPVERMEGLDKIARATNQMFYDQTGQRMRFGSPLQLTIDGLLPQTATSQAVYDAIAPTVLGAIGPNESAMVLLYGTNFATSNDHNSVEMGAAALGRVGIVSAFYILDPANPGEVIKNILHERGHMLGIKHQNNPMPEDLSFSRVARVPEDVSDLMKAKNGGAVVDSSASGLYWNLGALDDRPDYAKALELWVPDVDERFDRIAATLNPDYVRERITGTYPASRSFMRRESNAPTPSDGWMQERKFIVLVSPTSDLERSTWLWRPTFENWQHRGGADVIGFPIGPPDDFGRQVFELNGQRTPVNPIETTRPFEAIGF